MEVQSPYNRICISHNREGHRAFAVFLLSFFVGKCRRAVSGVRCRSPPLHLDFYISKIQIGGISGEIRTKKSIYQRKRRLCGTVLYGFLPPQASRQASNTSHYSAGYWVGSGISPLIFGRRKTGWHIKLRRTRFGRNPRKAV